MPVTILGFALAIGLTLGWRTAAAEEFKVVYAQQDSGADRIDYGVEILKLALGKSGATFTLTPSTEVAVTQARAVELVKEGKVANITWAGTGPDLEHSLLPVRVPIDRGILGWRLLIINPSRQAEFDKIQDLAGLRKLTAGQGDGWTDVQILQANGITVKTERFDRLFEMLGNKEFDFFPLGANEIFPITNQYKSILVNIGVEKNLCLVYPFAMFFFVTPSEPKLAAAIERGLKKAMADGSFDEVSRTHPWLREAFQKADLPHRRIIYIDNPLLTPETRNLPKDMFYHP
jgi:hypothetical protein